MSCPSSPPSPSAADSPEEGKSASFEEKGGGGGGGEGREENETGSCAVEDDLDVRVGERRQEQEVAGEEETCTERETAGAIE